MNEADRFAAKAKGFTEDAIFKLEVLQDTVSMTA